MTKMATHYSVIDHRFIYVTGLGPTDGRSVLLAWQYIIIRHQIGTLMRYFLPLTVSMALLAAGIG